MTRDARVQFPPKRKGNDSWATIHVVATRAILGKADRTRTSLVKTGRTKADRTRTNLARLSPAKASQTREIPVRRGRANRGNSACRLAKWSSLDVKIGAAFFGEANL